MKVYFDYDYLPSYHYLNTVGFSLTNWYGNLSVAPGTTLYPSQLSVLRESLGVTDYLNSATNRCDRSSAPFTPLTPGLTGWRIGKLVEDCDECGHVYY